MKKSGAGEVVRGLEAEGIAFAFGIPGTHNIELYDALAAAERVRPVLVTDEQSASFMADGAWRASGRMACVNVVPGAGLTHAMSGIAEAFMDNVPMLVLGCGVRQDLDLAFQLHDVDQAAMVAPVVKASFRPQRVADIEPAIRHACRLARTGVPGPVFVEIPADLYLLRGEMGLSAGDSPLPEPGAGLDKALASAAPEPERVLEAAQILGDCRRPLLYVGAGAVGAREELVDLSRRLEAPVSSTFQGKGVFPESDPMFLWPGFGDAAPPFVRKIAAGCDATLAVGCRFGEVATASYGMRPPRPLIHVDIDPAVPGRNFEADVPVVSDARLFLQALLDALPARRRDEDRELRERIASGHQAVRDTWISEVGGPRVTPAHLLGTLQRRLGVDAIFATDSGNGTFLAAECLRLEAPRRFLAPVDYSCMGYAVPAALGAKMACPEAPVVALAGDGAFLMTGLELLTAAREGLGVIVVVLRDRELAQIAQFQETALNRKACSELPDYDLVGLARGLGVPYVAMGSDAEVEAAVAEAAALAEAGRPVVVEAAIDYSGKTFFTRGVVKTNLLRLPWNERVRYVGRALVRRITG